MTTSLDGRPHLLETLVLASLSYIFARDLTWIFCWGEFYVLINIPDDDASH